MIVAAPEIINRYFRAVAEDDIDTLVGCFTDDAAVADEGRTHRGRDAIRAWREQTKSAYQYTAEVLRTEQNTDSRFEVTARLAGTFPGSPVELKYLFTLRDGLISGLDIE
jgi:ketosteroid isomerase-like protein